MIVELYLYRQISIASFEKMFAGNFLGDVARRLFLQLTTKGLLFDGVVMSGLRTKDAFRAANAVQVEQ